MCGAHRCAVRPGAGKHVFAFLDPRLDPRVKTHFGVELQGQDVGPAPKRLVKRGLNEVAKRRPTLGPQIVIVARKPG